MRLEGWESRLNAVVAEARVKPYALGEHDCFRMACRVVEALTGRDRWPEFAGYRTREEALRLLARHGRSFEEAFDWFFGSPRLPARMARRGDACALQDRRGEKHLGICLGARVALLADGGLTFYPLLRSGCCWRIG